MTYFAAIIKCSIGFVTHPPHLRQRNDFPAVTEGWLLFDIRFYHMVLDLWSEISLFHKLIYDIAQGSILIGLDVAVHL